MGRGRELVLQDLDLVLELVEPVADLHELHAVPRELAVRLRDRLLHLHQFTKCSTSKQPIYQ